MGQDQFQVKFLLLHIALDCSREECSICIITALIALIHFSAISFLASSYSYLFFFLLLVLLPILLILYTYSPLCVPVPVPDPAPFLFPSLLSSRNPTTHILTASTKYLKYSFLSLSLFLSLFLSFSSQQTLYIKMTTLLSPLKLLGVKYRGSVDHHSLLKRSASSGFLLYPTRWNICLILMWWVMQWEDRCIDVILNYLLSIKC